MIGRKGIYIGIIDSIDIIYKIVVKHFLLFIIKLAIYKDRYQIGYTAGDPNLILFKIFPNYY